jgi:hypothetical protein
MKVLTLAFITILSATTIAAEGEGLLRGLYSGTQIEFAQRVDLSQGQRSLLIGSSKCSLRFANTSVGRKHIPAGQDLVVSHVEVNPERDGVNPMTGKKIRILSSLKIKFKGLKSSITCRGENALSYSIQDLESDGILKITTPSKSERFIIE